MRKPQFFRQNKGFRRDDHGRGEHHVIAQLHALPCARFTAMDDVAPHLLQDRLGTGEMLLRAADHEGECPGFRPHHPARDRRIHKGAAGFCGNIARRCDINGGTINHQGIRRARRRHATRAKPGITHMLASGQHGDDVFGTTRRIRRTGRALGAGGHHGGNRRRYQIKYRHLMAGLQQVARHMGAHIAKSNKTYPRHGSVPFL